MKKLFITILLIYAFKGYGQTFRAATSSSSSAPTTYTKAGSDAAIKAAVDALAATLRAEIKAGDAASAKALNALDSSLVPADTNTLKLVNGKFTVNYKPAFDSAGAVQFNLTTTTKTLTDNINIVSGRTTTLENKVSNLEAWKGAVDSQLTTINSKIATIPTKAVSVSTTTTTTTLQQ